MATDAMARELTFRQREFCSYYAFEGNGTKAAILARYSPHTARQMASENLTKPHIVAEIDRLRRVRARRIEGDGDAVVSALWEIVDSSARGVGKIRALKHLARVYGLF